MQYLFMDLPLVHYEILECILDFGCGLYQAAHCLYLTFYIVERSVIFRLIEVADITSWFLFLKCFSFNASFPRFY